MTIAALLHDLQGRGVRLQVHGDRLRIEAPAGVLTPEVRETLAAHKAELLQRLAPDPGRLLALPLDAFATAGQMLEIRVPWCQASLWFVSGTPDAEVLVVEGISRGQIWTAAELLDLLSIPGVTTATARTIAEAKRAIDGDLTAVRQP